ncbi:MAG: hypothetical protein ACT4OF_09465 [Caulobacteraceae bacterium]
MLARGILFAAALLLSGCVFSSDTALFSDDEAVQPFDAAARFLWRESGDSEAHDVTFRANGAHYKLGETGDSGDEDMDVMFVPVAWTPEDDYIAQVRLPGGEGVAYAFVWRTADGFRALAGPGAIESEGVAQQIAQFCDMRAYGECRFRTREDALAYYRRIVYAPFVHGDMELRSYIDLIPIDQTAPPPAAERPRK